MTSGHTPVKNASQLLGKGSLCNILAILSLIYTFIATGFLIIGYIVFLPVGIYFNAKGLSQALQIEIGEENSRDRKLFLKYGNLFFLILGSLLLLATIVLIIGLQNFRWPG
ncbi:MAG: hypothetical protein AAFV95_12230 [Bacteroidota bacterium]